MYFSGGLDSFAVLRRITIAIAEPAKATATATVPEDTHFDSLVFYPFSFFLGVRVCSVLVAYSARLPGRRCKRDFLISWVLVRSLVRVRVKDAHRLREQTG